MTPTASHTAAPRADADLTQRVHDAIARSPKAMTITLARNLGVPEAEVIANLPDGRGIELDASRATELIEAFEAFAMTHVITNNGVVTLEAFGQFGNFSHTGPYFNIQTQSLDMHIRHKELDRVFAVEKPSHTDGVSTRSFQFFKPDGASAFKVFLTFGGKPAPPEKLERFNSLCDEFRLNQKTSNR